MTHHAPSADITVCRPIAPPELRRARIASREIGAGLDWHLNRTDELEAILEASAPEDLRVDNGDRPIRDVAIEVLERAGCHLMARFDYVVLDAEVPSAIARFWAAALDGYEIRAYDDAEVARLASIGLTPETDTSVMVDGPGPTLCFQKIPEPKAVKNRLHLDISAVDRTAEVERLVALGATVYQEQEDITTLQDPEGNEFCVIDRR